MKLITSELPAGTKRNIDNRGYTFDLAEPETGVFIQALFYNWLGTQPAYQRQKAKDFIDSIGQPIKV